MFGGLGETVEGYRVSFWGNRNVLRLIWKWIYNFAYTRCHWIVHFKCVNCMVGELYLNEAVLCCYFFLIVIYGEQTCCQEGGAWGKDGLGV